MTTHKSCVALRQRAVALCFLCVGGCNSGDGAGGNPVKIGDPGHADAGPGDGDPGTPPPPWDTLTWTYETVEGTDQTKPSGVQGKMVRTSDGTLHYLFLKKVANMPTCDIAVFGGEAAPGVNYELHAGARAAGASTWTVDVLPLSQVGPPNYVTSRFGLDATLDGTGRVVVAVAAGGPGLAACGSTDLVLGTRNGPNSWTLTAPVTGSGACCNDCVLAPTPDPCIASGTCECCSVMQNACRTGTDVGAWAAIARSSSGTIGVAFTDYHNFWDVDGQAFRGSEIYEGAPPYSGGAITGIRPWSDLGLYAALAYVGTVPVVAFTGYKQNGLHVLTRASGTDWTDVSVATPFSTLKLGERIQLAVAPNGTLGLLFHVGESANGAKLNQLYYCSSVDAGATWAQCRIVDSGVGGSPSLAFDGQSRPAASYYYCGPDPSCPQADDRPRFAWRDDQGTWWKFDLFHEASVSAGIYTSVVVDPTTGLPSVAFQDISRGTAMVAQGHFAN
ncbi:MAG: hypothetical protein HY903_17455 [Deltaproteobacteria bacterium]|nr:hypothetical protein [Deltaproteobacteria bacterium]